MSDSEASQEKRRAQPSLRRTPPLAILILFCTAFLLGQFDEADFSGWTRLAAIWAATLGFCLLAAAVAYSFTRLPPSIAPCRSFPSRLYALCLIACYWSLTDGVRETRRALDPNRWKEWTTHHVNIPMLSTNESLKLLLGSSHKGVDVDVYKPRVMVLRIGDETKRQTLRTRMVPFEDFWDDQASWFLSGPDETPIAEPTRTKPRK